MNYGLYLSAQGVIANSFRQDVIANNLANTETVGFKRSLALVQQRRTEAQELNTPGDTNPILEGIGGGLMHRPTIVDRTQGSLEKTGNNLDLAIHGKGFFAVQDGKEMRLTRNGRMMLDREGFLILGDGSSHKVLDSNRNPIQLRGMPESQIEFRNDGTLAAAGQVIGRLGMFDVPDESQLEQKGSTLLSHPDIKKLPQSNSTIQAGFIENSNVDPTTELTQLINAQRQLEANANMIRYQDQSLGKLVTEVGKIG